MTTTTTTTRKDSSYVSRINQIDASQLDNEIYKIAREQSSNILKICAPGIVGKWRPEIDAFLKIAIWNYSLRTGNSSFGQKLLNLRYDNYDKKKSFIHLLLDTLPIYLKEKIIDNYNNNIDKKKRIKYFLRLTSNFAQLLSFVNIFIFLNRGNQPNIIEIILGIYNRPIKSNRPRNIGYSYMTRELLWHSLIELFTIVLPMINIHFIKRNIKRIFSSSNYNISNQYFKPIMKFNTICPECDQTPNLPRHAGCQHIFCYYCIKARFAIDDSYECPRCGIPLNHSQLKTV